MGYLSQLLAGCLKRTASFLISLKYGIIPGDILKNLAETYNSLLEKARVPVEAWEPGKQFYVRDETAVISGAIDQGLEELKDIPDLIGLGLTLVSDPVHIPRTIQANTYEYSYMV